MLPLIGITTYGRAEKLVSNVAFADHFCTPALYVDAMRRAGAAVVLLPTEELDPSRLLAALDGIVFAGGADIEPGEYGGNSKHPELGVTHSQRDRTELALLQAALQHHDIPLLFICRGMQLLNVAQGGTLHEHIVDLGKGDIHRCKTHFWAKQSVDILKGTRLHSAIQRSSVLTMSGHHQGIRELGADLTISAIAEDGIVEAVEHNAHPFAVGVQWHPEASAASDADQQRLFDAFVNIAVQRAQLRGVGPMQANNSASSAGKRSNRQSRSTLLLSRQFNKRERSIC
jgi:putative glutamine amidotransferase